MIVRDGEGASKLIEINVTGAQTDQDAVLVAKAIAESNLVKTAVLARTPTGGALFVP